MYTFKKKPVKINLRNNLLVTILALMTFAINADQNSLTAGNQKVAKRFYINAQVGYGRILSSDAPDLSAVGIPPVSRNRGGMAYRLGFGYSLLSVGGFRLNSEVGYLHYPDTSYQVKGTYKPSKISQNVFDLLLSPTYYFIYNSDNSFFVLANIGAAYVNQKILIGGTGAKYPVGTTGKHSGVLPEAGIGAGFGFNQQYEMYLTYNHIFGKEPLNSTKRTYTVKFNNIVSSDVLMLGFRYSF